MNDLNIEENINQCNEQINQIQYLLFDFMNKINYDNNINIKINVKEFKTVIKDMLDNTKNILNIIGGSTNNDIKNNINNINNVITEIYNYMSNNNNNNYNTYDTIENITNILDKNTEIERIFEIYK